MTEMTSKAEIFGRFLESHIGKMKIITTKSLEIASRKLVDNSMRSCVFPFLPNVETIKDCLTNGKTIKDYLTMNDFGLREGRDLPLSEMIIFTGQNLMAYECREHQYMWRIVRGEFYEIVFADQTQKSEDPMSEISYLVMSIFKTPRYVSLCEAKMSFCDGGRLTSIENRFKDDGIKECSYPIAGHLPDLETISNKEAVMLLNAHSPKCPILPPREYFTLSTRIL